MVGLRRRIFSPRTVPSLTTHWNRDSLHRGKSHTSRSSSTMIYPTLCRVFSYCLPGLPSQTMSFILSVSISRKREKCNKKSLLTERFFGFKAVTNKLQEHNREIRIKCKYFCLFSQYPHKRHALVFGNCVHQDAITLHEFMCDMLLILDPQCHPPMYHIFDEFILFRSHADLFVELVEWNMRYHPELVRRLPPTLSLQYMEEYTFHEEHIRELA